VQNRASVTQSLVGLSLPIGVSNQWRVDWCPISFDGSEQFCVRATVTAPGDSNTDNKRVLSSFGSVRIPPTCPGIRAGKAFVSAPRTFALELNSGADTGATPMTVSRMIDVSKQMTAGGGQAEIADGQAARW
jgi:hypothetical protein